MKINEKMQTATMVAAIIAFLACLSTYWTNSVGNASTAVLNEIENSGTGFIVDFNGFYGETEVLIIDVKYTGNGGNYVVVGETEGGDIKEFPFSEGSGSRNILITAILFFIITFVGSFGLFIVLEKFLPDDFLESDVRE